MRFTRVQRVITPAEMQAAAAEAAHQQQLQQLLLLQLLLLLLQLLQSLIATRYSQVHGCYNISRRNRYNKL